MVVVAFVQSQYLRCLADRLIFFGLTVSLLCSRFDIIVHLDVPSPPWAFRSWWLFLVELLKKRNEPGRDSLIVKWCPAHSADKCNDQTSLDYFAHLNNTSVRNIILNRAADEAAKKAVLEWYPDRVNYERNLVEKEKWQTWLVSVADLLSTLNNEAKSEQQDVQVVQAPALSEGDPLEKFQHVYPLWTWNHQGSNYGWTSDAQVPEHCRLPASLLRANWNCIIRFLQSLRWEIKTGVSTSFLELAYCCRYQGFELQGPDTPAFFATQIKKTLNHASKLGNLMLAPVCTTNNCKSNGKTHPIGMLRGCQPLIPNEILMKLGTGFLGRSHALSCWNFSFP